MGITNPKKWRLFWLSFLILFIEIMAIRWMGIEIPTVRVFPNLVMMGVLIATSAGLLSNEAKDTKLSVSPIFFWLSSGFLLLVLIAAPQLHIYEQSIHLHNEWYEVSLSIGFLFVAMLSLYVIFFKLGTLLTPLFNGLPPLTAYTANLAGSIAGTLAFFLISYFTAPPYIWLLIVGIIVFILRRKPADLLVALIVACITFGFNHKSYWSPYSKLDVLSAEAKDNPVFVQGSYVLNSNNNFFQAAINTVSTPLVRSFLNSPTSDTDFSAQQAKRCLRWLEIPFLCAPKTNNILVLGAGSGNDVSYALGRGVPHIDAVEIDPIICRLGKIKHPNRPYLDTRVSLHNEDARTFLRYTKNKYDLVEFTFLDPGNTLCSSSFLRVDSYVYTKEAIESVLRCLNPDGIASISFATDKENSITAKLYNTIQAAWGQPPLTLINKKYMDILLFFGPGLSSAKISDILASHPDLESWVPTHEQALAPAITDQWPFLYTCFNNAGIAIYFAILFALIVVPAIFVFLTQKKDTAVADLSNMFLLGLAFMLIETKSIVQLSLLFGSTWVVSAAVITTVLCLALLANLVIQKAKPIPLPYLYTALALAILLDYFFSVPSATNLHPLLIAFVSVLITCLPVFFSGMIFSSCFLRAKNPSSYLATNLLGVAFGGVAENLSLICGIKGLTWVALGIYCLSALCVYSKQQSRTNTNKN